MRHQRWLAALTVVAFHGLAPAQALWLKDMFHRGETKKKGQEQIAICVKKRACMAYFQDDAGVLSPVRGTLNTNNDQDWLGLLFTDDDGPRIRLGVLNVINKSAEAEEKDRTERIEVH